MRKQHFSALLQGVQGEKKAENFLCIIKSWAFPAWLRQPALFRAERTKADQIAGRESDGRHVSPMDECPGWSSPIPNHPRLSAPPVLGTGGAGAELGSPRLLAPDEKKPIHWGAGDSQYSDIYELIPSKSPEMLPHPTWEKVLRISYKEQEQSCPRAAWGPQAGRGHPSQPG